MTDTVAAAEVVSAADAGTPETREPVASGSLVADHFAFALAIYHLPVPHGDPSRELNALLRNRKITAVSAKRVAPPAGIAVELRAPKIAYFAPPDAESLKYFSRGLSDEEKERLGQSRVVTLLEFSGPGDRAVEAYRQAIDVIGVLSQRLGGLVWDEETREVFSAAAWAKRKESWAMGLPNVAAHVIMHSYRDGELLRLVTLGMTKFALPDVSVNGVSSSDSGSMGNLVNLACQTLLERGRLDQPGALAVSLDAVKEPTFREHISSDVKPNAKRQTVLTLAVADRQEGDAQNRLIEIIFPGPASEIQQRHNQAIQEVFGAGDEIVHVEHDPEILAASRRAKKALLRQRSRYREGPPFNERLMVKAPFTTSSGGNEWMWVEVVRWDGKTIEGILQNDPYEVPDLKAGARVKVEDGAIFDYILHKADGSIEGNETGRLIEAKSHGR